MRRLVAPSLLLALAACGDDGAATPIDAPKIPIDAPADAPADVPFDAPPPPANHFHYAMSTLLVPMNNNQARDFGVDLDGDQVIDNQLGMVMGTLSSMGFDIQTATTAQVDRGQVIELFDLGADSFTTAPNATFAAYIGATPMPPACNNAGDVVCRHHLTGAGTFTIASTSPTNPALTGTIAAGAMTTAAGHLVVPLMMVFGSAPIYVTLLGAKVQLSQASDSALMMLKLTGGLSQTDIDTKLIPAMRDSLQASVVKDCTALASPPQCGCPSGSTGKTSIDLFDTNHDCTISVAEVQNNSLIQSLLAPDVTLEGQRCLSFGMRATAVKAGFVAP
jgi:hypothetical protein